MTGSWRGLIGPAILRHAADVEPAPLAHSKMAHPQGDPRWSRCYTAASLTTCVCLNPCFLCLLFNRSNSSHMHVRFRYHIRQDCEGNRFRIPALPVWPGRLLESDTT